MTAILFDSQVLTSAQILLIWERKESKRKQQVMEPGRNNNNIVGINYQDGKKKNAHTTIFLQVEPHTHTTCTWRQELAFITWLINFSSNRFFSSRTSTAHHLVVVVVAALFFLFLVIDALPTSHRCGPVFLSMANNRSGAQQNKIYPADSVSPTFIWSERLS